MTADDRAGVVTLASAAPSPLLQVASDHAVADVPVAAPSERAGDLRARLAAGHRYQSAVDVAVVDGGRLVGLVRIEDLLAAGPDDTAGELMDGDPPCIGPDTDQEAAAWKAVHHGQSSLAVVGPSGELLGLIPPYRLLGVLLREHDEDLARIAGYLHDTRSARRASEEPVHARLWHRLPWLLIGLAGAVVSAVVVGLFDTELEADVAIASFVPGIVYLADAVGTQTEALVIRGLSVGVSIRRVVRLELVTGVALGVLLGIAFLPVGVLGWSAELAVAVALSIGAACMTATLVAMGLPVLLSRFGTDPAFGSGPLATVVQDLLSLAIYLAVATTMVA